MILTQFYLNCLAHASYLIGDEQTRTAVVVDHSETSTSTWRVPRRMG